MAAKTQGSMMGIWSEVMTCSNEAVSGTDRAVYFDFLKVVPASKGKVASNTVKTFTHTAWAQCLGVGPTSPGNASFLFLGPTKVYSVVIINFDANSIVTRSSEALSAQQDYSATSLDNYAVWYGGPG
jgi:hypothetical protein